MSNSINQRAPIPFYPQRAKYPRYKGEYIDPNGWTTIEEVFFSDFKPVEGQLEAQELTLVKSLDELTDDQFNILDEFVSRRKHYDQNPFPSYHKIGTFNVKGERWVEVEEEAYLYQDKLLRLGLTAMIFSVSSKPKLALFKDFPPVLSPHIH